MATTKAAHFYWMNRDIPTFVSIQLYFCDSIAVFNHLDTLPLAAVAYFISDMHVQTGSCCSFWKAMCTFILQSNQTLQQNRLIFRCLFASIGSANKSTFRSVRQGISPFHEGIGNEFSSGLYTEIIKFARRQNKMMYKLKYFDYLDKPKVFMHLLHLRLLASVAVSFALAFYWLANHEKHKRKPIKCWNMQQHLVFLVSCFLVLWMLADSLFGRCVFNLGRVTCARIPQ